MTSGRSRRTDQRHGAADLSSGDIDENTICKFHHIQLKGDELNAAEIKRGLPGA